MAGEVRMLYNEGGFEESGRYCPELPDWPAFVLPDKGDIDEAAGLLLGVRLESRLENGSASRRGRP